MLAKNSNILEQATRARSVLGTPIPEALITKLVELSKEKSDYHFMISSAHSLSRGMQFFRAKHCDLVFYNMHGEEFEYQSYRKEFTNHEIFMAINYLHNVGEAHVFMYFPNDRLRWIIPHQCLINNWESRIGNNKKGQQDFNSCWPFFYFFFLSLFVWRSLAIPILPDSTSSVIVEPAAINTSSPKVTGATKLTFEPIKALSPIIVLCLFFPS